MSRYIDADKLINDIKDGSVKGMNVYTAMWSVSGIKAVINAQPTVEAEPHWIEPDANHLPPLEEDVLVVWEVSGQYGIAALTEYQDKTGETYKVWEDDMSGFHSIYSVRMWMPIPKMPEEAERNDK